MTIFISSFANIVPLSNITFYFMKMTNDLLQNKATYMEQLNYNEVK